MADTPSKTAAPPGAGAGKEAGAAGAPIAQTAASAGSEDGFDRVVERLRGVVEKLEAGSLGLEQSLSAFEEGVRLSRRGAEILDRAERRVELLLRGDESDRVVPFPSGTEGAGDGDGT